MSKNCELINEFGINSRAEARLVSCLSPNQRNIYLQKELKTYINHTIEDCVVSLPYYYQFKNNEVQTYPSGIPLNIDEEERGGLYKIGVTQAIKSAIANPNQLVLLYSPPGPVDFNHNPRNKYRQIKPYDRGQLNIMFFDQEKVINVSVMISTTSGLEWLTQIMSRTYLEATAKQTAIDQISYFITHPQVSNFCIDDFLNHHWRNSDDDIFENRHKQKFSLNETLKLIHDSLNNQLEILISNRPVDFGEIKNIEITEHIINKMYENAVYDYMIQNKLTQLPLGGGCGSGTVVKLSSVMEFLNNLSSPIRNINQRSVLFNINNDENYFECPKCHGKIPSGQGIETCPHCHITKDEYAKQSSNNCD